MRISTTVVFEKETSVTRMTPNDFDGDQQVVLTHDSLFGVDSWSQITFFVPGVEAADALVAALRGCFPVREEPLVTLTIPPIGGDEEPFF